MQPRAHRTEQPHLFPQRFVHLDRCNYLINLLLSLLRIPSVIGEATIELDTVLSHLIRPESGQSMQPTVIFEAASHSSIFFHKFHFRTNTPAAIKYEPPLTRSRWKIITSSGFISRAINHARKWSVSAWLFQIFYVKLNRVRRYLSLDCVPLFPRGGENFVHLGVHFYGPFDALPLKNDTSTPISILYLHIFA